MAIEQELDVVPVSSRKRVKRTQRIAILTPKDATGYDIIGLREHYIVEDGVEKPDDQPQPEPVKRHLADVISETITVGDNTYTVAEIATVISKLMDRWAEEDLLAIEAANLLNGQ